MYTKGASEIVLETCSHWLNEQGERVELTEASKKKIMDEIEAYAK